MKIVKNFNKFFFFFFSILPLSIIAGPSISLINILILILIYFAVSFNDYHYKTLINSKVLKLLLFIYFYLILNSILSVDSKIGLVRNLGFIRIIIFFILINYFFYIYQNNLKIFNFWSFFIIIFVLDVYLERFTGTNIFGWGAQEINGVQDGFFLTVGRFTKQKNHIYLITEFEKFLTLYPNEKLVLIGEGELKKKMQRIIKKKKLSNNIFLIDYTENVYFYMKKSKALVLTSLWEDPGFVIIEAALCNTTIISSNCKNGPKEFLLNGRAGLIFENNKENELLKKLEEFKKLEKNDIFKKKLLAKKNSAKFTMFRHYLSLNKIIQTS